jgi:hypothetical protein
MNAKEELFLALRIHDKTIQAAFILYKQQEFILRNSHTPENLKAFLECLNFNYCNSAYFGTSLEGTIWLKGGGWLERYNNGNDDNAEQRWYCCERPIMPQNIRT